MSTELSHHEHFDAVPQSARHVRRVVDHVLSEWGRDDVAYQAVLGASELASNAVLHARNSFELVMRPIEGGARIEIVDRRPDLVPLPVPVTGAATHVTAEGTTGRGLQIVASVANRWGFNSSQAHKAVWLEVTADAPETASAPVVEIGYRPAPDAHARRYRLLSMPVRAAVASGVHVEDVVRELQLSAPAAVTTAEREQLYGLLDASAPARLLGRHAALGAAARGLDRFDMDVALSAEALQAFVELNRLLAVISGRVGGSADAAPPTVADFRAWVLREVAAQSEGREPSVCDLATGT
jgi:anti-sigma regulatory factor (Ser/Thr protein kinase)